MELQLYVGPLTRAYMPPEADGAMREQVCRAVCEWRDMLAQGLQSEDEEEAFWEEAPDLPFLYTEPTWQGYYALLLTALAAETGETLDTADGWMERFEQWPLWQKAAAQYNGAYPELLQWADIRLPMQTAVLVTCPDPSDQQQITVTAAGPALDQLEGLVKRVWNADRCDLGAWYALPPQGDLTACAKRAAAHLHRALTFALDKHLPITAEY